MNLHKMLSKLLFICIALEVTGDLRAVANPLLVGELPAVLRE